MPTASMGVANLAVGGEDLKTLYIGGFNDLYTVTVKVAGIA